MPYDIDYRGQDLTAVNTAVTLNEIGAAAPGNFQVPGNVSRITEVRISATVDTINAVDAALTAVHLSGAGIGTAGFFAFPGPAFTLSGVAGTSAQLFGAMPEVYHVNIPVVAGGEIQAIGYGLENFPSAGVRIGCTLVYDGIAGRIVDVDYRTVSVTAANTHTTLTNRAGAAVNSFKTTGRPIVEVRPNGGVIGTTGPLGAITDYYLYGAGLVNAGNYHFEGPAHFIPEEHDVAGAYSTLASRHVTNIALKAGNLIDVDAMMIEDDLGTLEAVCALCYG